LVKGVLMSAVSERAGRCAAHHRVVDAAPAPRQRERAVQQHPLAGVWTGHCGSACQHSVERASQRPSRAVCVGRRRRLLQSAAQELLSPRWGLVLRQYPLSHRRVHRRAAAHTPRRGETVCHGGWGCSEPSVGSGHTHARPRGCIEVHLERWLPPARPVSHAEPHLPSAAESCVS
jgi:hypothetical protein